MRFNLTLRGQFVVVEPLDASLGGRASTPAHRIKTDLSFLNQLKRSRVEDLRSGWTVYEDFTWEQVKNLFPQT